MISTTISKLADLREKAQGQWAQRILSQLEYAFKLSKVNKGKFDKLLREAVAFLYDRFDQEGVITKNTAVMTENMIIELSDAAKSFKMLCAAHAHIDMNWKWGFAETVAITLDTFRTILKLMSEYPDFKFSQSQASVYKIVEEFDPEMLKEIKLRVREGRWEVTASTWVEADKNMPSGESLCRHILYTKRYLSELLDIPLDSMKLDFEPDTFGHSSNIPEILSNGGVNYYYHCRGYEGHHIYKWEAPSGKSVLTYREPVWYNAYFHASAALLVPEFCTKHGINTMLKVYGVGDHGGGPTRRDVEKIIDMGQWPVFPDIRFGTFDEFFEILNTYNATLPVVKQELNFIFSGCYSSQSRIKSANRIGEIRLGEAEAFCSFAALQKSGQYFSSIFENAWRKLLFNHFHDIITGAGVIDTREYAMGEFQKVLATANTEMSRALRNISSQINTEALIPDEANINSTISEGAGVGFAVKDFSLPQTERGRGRYRLFHFFNPSPHDRCEPVEITVWDWTGKPKEIQVLDTDGSQVKHQLISWGSEPSFEKNHYWGHWYIKLLLDVRVPAYGYSTYILNQCDKDDFELDVPYEPRLEKPDEYLMENDHVKAVFDTKTAALVSLQDKRTGLECVDREKLGGIFRLIQEDDSKGMTAWYMGRYKHITDLGYDVKFTDCNLERESLRQFITYEINFEHSKMLVVVSLDYNRSMLDFSVECDWGEIGRNGAVPQLGFYLPLAYPCSTYKYDIPFGTTMRESMNMDVPANSWIVGMPGENENCAVMLVTDSKYGYRGAENALAVTLIRSSYDPDPYPEIGIHSFRFAVGTVESLQNYKLIYKAFDYNHPIHFISASRHNGVMESFHSFMRLLKGNIVVSSIKMPEMTEVKNKMLIRVYETEGTETESILQFPWKVVQAYWTDINENVIEGSEKVGIDEFCIRFKVTPFSIGNLCVEFSI